MLALLLHHWHARDMAREVAPRPDEQAASAALQALEEVDGVTAFDVEDGALYLGGAQFTGAWLSQAEDRTSWWRERASQGWTAWTGVLPARAWEHPIVLTRVERDADGSLQVTGLHVEMPHGRPLAVRDLRSLRLADLAARSAAPALVEPDGPVEQGPYSIRPGRRGYPPEHWWRVAVAYRAAQRHAPRGPVKWLAEHWDPPVSTASVHRWLNHPAYRSYLKEQS